MYISYCSATSLDRPAQPRMEPIREPGPATSAARAHLDQGFRFEKGGTLGRALDIYGDALAAAQTPGERAEASLRIARVYRTLARFDESIEQARRAIELADEAGDDDLAAEAMNVEIGALQMRGSFDEADAIALAAMQRARSPRVRGITLQNLGRSAAERRDFMTSDDYFERSIVAFREARYEIGLSVSLVNAARAALDRGDALRAIDIGQEAIAVARRLNMLDILSTAVQNQAAAFVALGNVESAEGLLTEALGHFTSARNPQRQAECLEIMGQMTELRPDHETAARCYARAHDLALRAGDQTLIDRLTRRLEAASKAARSAHSAVDDRAG
jgi:tetratricopeptide (TPR) repeat protein